MDDMLKFLSARIAEDRSNVADAHASPPVSGSHLRVLDSIEELVDEFRGLPDPWDDRLPGLLYVLRVFARMYATHPDYRAEEWHP
ncbi:hypothetical protein ACFU9F_24520 [Streptomyces zhihengii]|uniref:hypothetical protein n=1 Tax=Streptomyces zhihengii TaxID=1818004 RepID=UPI00369ED52B